MQNEEVENGNALSKEEKVEAKQDQRTLQDIDMDKIIISEDEVRKLYPEKEIEDLVKNMGAFGLLQPIEVRKQVGKDGDGKERDFYAIVYGQRRYMAAKILKWSKIRAWILPDIIPEKEDMTRSLAESIHLALDPADKLAALDKLLAENDNSYEDVSKKTGIRVETLQSWNRYRIVPKPIREMVSRPRSDRERVTYKDAMAVSALSQQSDEEKLKIVDTVKKIRDVDHKKDIMSYIQEHPEATAEEIKRDTIDDFAEPVISMQIDFTPEVSKAIDVMCKRRGLKRDDFVKTAVITYLGEKGGFKDI